MRRWIVLLAAISGLTGCRRSPPAGNDAGSTSATTAAATTTAEPDETVAPPPRELPTAPEQLAPLEIDAGSTTVVENAAPPPPPDPFDAAVTSVRTAAVGCFASLPPGEYAASIAVTVTPAGTATRVEVTYGPDDAAVRKCLEQAATRGYPASVEGRKLSIDVRVKG